MTPIPAPKRIRQSAPIIHTISHRQSIQLLVAPPAAMSHSMTVRQGRYDPCRSGQVNGR